jgi:hypothetical protein
MYSGILGAVGATAFQSMVRDKNPFLKLDEKGNVVAAFNLSSDTEDFAGLIKKGSLEQVPGLYEALAVQAGVGASERWLWVATQHAKADWIPGDMGAVNVKGGVKIERDPRFYSSETIVYLGLVDGKMKWRGHLGTENTILDAAAWLTHVAEKWSGAGEAAFAPDRWYPTTGLDHDPDED